MTFTFTTRTVEERGLELPWERLERYGPEHLPGHPPRGTVLESGTVFIPVNALYEVADRTTDDYLWENPPPQVGYHAQLALVKAGLAEEETRGGIHGTPALRELLGRENWE